LGWTRRQFLTRTSGGIALAATPLWSGSWRPAALRAAIVGLGTRGSRHIAAGLIPEVRLTHICDTNDAALREAARRCQRWLRHEVAAAPALDAVLRDPGVDAVVVAVPLEARARIARAALEAGKHVYCEPPWSANSAEGTGLLEAAAQHGRLVWQGSAEPSWQSHVVDGFLGAAPFETGQIVVRRVQPAASGDRWSPAWLDALSSLTPYLQEIPPASKAIGAGTPFGQLAHVVFGHPSGVRAVLSESAAFGPVRGSEWTITVETSRRTSELWIGFRDEPAHAPDPGRDLASWQPFLTCLQRADVDTWRRSAERQQRANDWLRAAREAAI